MDQRVKRVNKCEWVTGQSVSEQCFTSPPTQYRLYGRRLLQVKRPNQQYQSTEGDATKDKKKQRKQLNTHTGWAKLSDTTLHFCL